MRTSCCQTHRSKSLSHRRPSLRVHRRPHPRSSSWHRQLQQDTGNKPQSTVGPQLDERPRLRQELAQLLQTPESIANDTSSLRRSDNRLRDRSYRQRKTGNLRKTGQDSNSGGNKLLYSRDINSCVGHESLVHGDHQFPRRPVFRDRKSECS